MAPTADEPAFPADFFPATAATAEFDLAPGRTRVVTACWPRAAVPPAGSRTTLLAAVLSRSAGPPPGERIDEAGCLARKDVIVAEPEDRAPSGA
ncbi:hypothetical protein [Geodermatophilus sp. SYSU D00710]